MQCEKTARYAEHGNTGPGARTAQRVPWARSLSDAEALALTPRAVLDTLATVQMLDVHFPTTDGRTLIMRRYTELAAEQKLLVKQLKLDLPPQPPPRITAPAKRAAGAARPL